MSDSIQRFSSRTSALHETTLLPYLRRAERYYRIAGYFTSSLFEIAGEELSRIPDVRIVCNGDISAEDLAVSKQSRGAKRNRESALLGRLESRVELDSLFNRDRYARLQEFLNVHPGAIRVAPDERCGFLHGKAGLIELTDGRELAFIGSMNETRAGWTQHYEILWTDESQAGVEWVKEEFFYLWNGAVVLPDVILTELHRRTLRVEIEIDAVEDTEELPPAALVETPMYREGLSLSSWQRAFVGEALKHLCWFHSVRLLLADEVGLGKTLSLATAALALTLSADRDRSDRSRVRPVAIFAPKALTEQWQTELVDKLGIPTARWSPYHKAWLDPDARVVSPKGASQIRRCPFRIGIISTGVIIQPTNERASLEEMAFDVLVLDESHKARKQRSPGKEDRPNELLRFMLSAAKRSRHVLLGTATPMQTQVDDLWDQLQILSQGVPFLFGHELSLWQYPDTALPLINGENRCKDPEEAWKFLSSPLPPYDSSTENDFRRVLYQIRTEFRLPADTFTTHTKLTDFPPELREEFEDLIRSEKNGTTFFQRHNPAVRHVVLRKRNVLEEQGLLDRVGVFLHPDPARLKDSTQYHYLFENKALFTTDTFQSAYEATGEFGRAYGKRVGGAGFMTNMLRQRLCSSIQAGANTARKLLHGLSLEEEIVETDRELSFDSEDIKPEALDDPERKALMDFLAAIEAMQEEDPKSRAVRHYLVTEEWASKYGCIVFSQYYDTTYWIARQVAELFPDQPVGVYAGAGRSMLLRGAEAVGIERESIKAMVERRELRLVVATDAACEGLNLQKLGSLINVDLPWNPVRLEQRIGRIKRFGQVRSDVDMLNLVYQGTVDETIYNRLSERMRDRYDLFGSLPDTIDDQWIEDEQKLSEYLDQFIEAQQRVNGFDLRYNGAIDPDDVGWRDCIRVLARRDLDDCMRRGW